MRAFVSVISLVGANHMDCMISFSICCIFCLSIHSGFLGCVFKVVLFHSVRISSSRESFIEVA